MALAKIPKTSFLSGEVDPSFNSAIETEKYREGLSKCENWMPDILGGIKNCPGMEYVETAYTSAEQSRLIPFQFNELQAYLLELADSRMRVFKDGGIVLRSLDAPTYAWHLSGSGTSEYYVDLVPSTDPGFPEPLVVFEDGAEMTAGTLGSLAAGEWDWGDNDALGFNTVYVRLSDSTNPTTKGADYVQIYSVAATPYPIAGVGELNYAQSTDTLYIAHGDFKPYKITRTSDEDWTVTVLPDMDGPYKPRQLGDEDIKIKIENVSGNTWKFTADTAIFGDVETGEPWRIGMPVPGDPAALYWSWYVVSTLTSDTVIEGIIQNDPARPTYQQIVNPKFKNGTDNWQDLSTPLVPPFTSRIEYDFTNQQVLLVDGAGGVSKMEQPVLTFPNVKHRIIFNISNLVGATPSVTLKVGTASGLGDIYTSVVYTTTGLKQATILPTQETVYVNFDTTGSTDADVVKIDQVEMFPIGDDPVGATTHSTTEWRFAAWNSTHGYPQHVFFDSKSQRLIFAKNDAEPQTIWASELGNFEGHGFSTPIRASDAFSFKPSTPEINGIRWLLEKDGLKVGTANAIWRVFAPSGGAISPTDIAIEIDEAEGSLDLKPIVAHNAILMTPRGETPLLELVSSLEAKGFAARDLGSVAIHLLKNRRIVRWAFAKDPDSVVWCALDNGDLLGFVYHRRYDVWGWFRRTCSFGYGYSDVVVIPNSNDDNIDDVYLLVDRGFTETWAHFGGGGPATSAPNYYIERLSKRITPNNMPYAIPPVEPDYNIGASGTPYDYRFLDSATFYDNPKIITNMTNPSGGNPIVVTSVAHGYSNGDEIRIQNVEGMREGIGLPSTLPSIVNNEIFVVTNKTADTYELYDTDGNPVLGFFATAYKGGGESRLMANVLSGLDHLDGQSVTVMGDGVAYEGLGVSSGSVTLPNSAKVSFAIIGVPYTAEAETLDIEAIFQSGGTQGRIKGLQKMDVYFIESRDCKVYASNRPTKEQGFEFNQESDGEEPPPLFEGVKEIDISSDHGKEVKVTFKQDKPYPVHIRRAILDVEFNR